MLRNLRINRAALFEAAINTAAYRAYSHSKAQELQEVAKEIFRSAQRRDNEGRLSETTPPKYLFAWAIEREGIHLFLINQDPAAMWVEFGARAGGETPVLRYKPLTRALEIVGSAEAQ